MTGCQQLWRAMRRIQNAIFELAKLRAQLASFATGHLVARASDAPRQTEFGVGSMGLINEYAVFWRAQSPRMKIISPLLLFYFVTLICGTLIGLLLSRIVPSTAGTYFGVTCGSFNGLVWVALLERNLRKREPSAVPTVRAVEDSTLLQYVWTRVPLMLCVGFMFGYTAFAWGYPWLYNEAFAPVVSKEVGVTGWENGSRGSCPRPKIGQNTFVIAPHALCADLDARELMQPGMLIRLVGPESVFGINVQEIYTPATT
jgi:hypothetical protein